MNKSTAGKKRIVIVAAFVILIVVMAAMFMIVRYTPTKEKMNGYVFFNLDKSTDKTMVIIDGKQYSDTGVVTDFIMIKNHRLYYIRIQHICIHI